ncbi:MAG: hypothetical protein HRU20_30705 [Pseudomonadales bacterium]|nr:hypothetical protein [Pseudomonadales bacterium]
MSQTTEMGLAIIAGSLGLAFSNIDKISRFKGAGFEAEMNMVQTIIETQTEASDEQKQAVTDHQTLTKIEYKVLKRLQKTGYTWRYAKTVANETRQAVVFIEACLHELMVRGLVKNGEGSNGEIWAATNLGKSLQEQQELTMRNQFKRGKALRVAS